MWQNIRVACLLTDRTQIERWEPKTRLILQGHPSSDLLPSTRFYHLREHRYRKSSMDWSISVNIQQRIQWTNPLMKLEALWTFQSPWNFHQLAQNSSGTALESNYPSSHILSIAEYHANSFLRFIMLMQTSVVCSPSTHPWSRYKHSGQLQRDTEGLLTTGLGEDPWGDWDCFGCWRYLVVTGQIHWFFSFPYKLFLIK